MYICIHIYYVYMLEKNIFPNLINSQELEPLNEPMYAGAGVSWKKI